MRIFSASRIRIQASKNQPILRNYFYWGNFLFSIVRWTSLNYCRKTRNHSIPFLQVNKKRPAQNMYCRDYVSLVYVSLRRSKRSNDLLLVTLCFFSFSFYLRCVDDFSPFLKYARPSTFAEKNIRLWYHKTSKLQPYLNVFTIHSSAINNSYIMKIA